MSSWLRSAMNKAVEVGSNGHISRVVRGYANNVVDQDRIVGTKYFQDHEDGLGFQNFKLIVKQLEELSMSCRGVERVELLRRWLAALKMDHTSGFQNNYDEVNRSSSKLTLALYHDPDLGEELMNFRDIFLQSQALEGITLSMILEEPNEGELSLLMEIFRVCLVGDEEVFNITFTMAQDLASVFSTCNEEVLAKRGELLQYAQDAIAGLKVDAEIEGIDSVVSNISKELEGKKSGLLVRMQKSDNCFRWSLESLKEAITYVGLFSRLEELLLRKKSIQKGDSREARSSKVDKLKVLTESLASSTIKAEKRVLELRTQKEEALKFRVAKTSEVTQLQKEFFIEITTLEKRKLELEEELRKVTTALIAANARLQKVNEERDQFDEASNHMIQHFKSKDDDLSKSIMLYRAEEKVCNAFVNFLERTWFFQALNTQKKEMLIKNELERHHNSFVNLAMSLLDAYKVEFRTCISLTSSLVEKLNGLDNDAGSKALERKIAIEQYSEIETKVQTIFILVYSIKKQICKQSKYLREDEARLIEQIDEIEKMKADFESMEKPAQEEMKTKARTSRVPFLSRRMSVKGEEKLDDDSSAQRGIVLPFNPIVNMSLVRSLSSGVLKEITVKLEQIEEGVRLINNKKFSNAEAQLSKLKLELEQESHSRGSSMDGLFDWEFDEKVDKTTKIL